MQVLIVGSGGREHALAWKLSQSPTVSRIYCAPGNGGIPSTPKCQLVPLAADDFEGLARFATVQNIHLTVVGPEVPLAAGIVDHFQALNLPIFGPTQAAAQIESSKSWAKALMQEAGIPTATYATFTALDPALTYVQTHPLPVVIKADGLAAGKGVTVAATLEDARQALTTLYAGSPDQQVVIESFLAGEEVSLLAFCDGTVCRPMLPIQDHKRVGEGDTGPNTGGMGAYGPVTLTPAQLNAIQTRILDPTLVALTARGIPYQGVLYAGLMISPAGDPWVVEFNCRFGDPETQVLMPLLATPLEEILLACVEGRLSDIDLRWDPRQAACVVMASGGYPGAYDKGNMIMGLEAAAQISEDVVVFHAGTRRLDPEKVVTDGGRVLCVTGWGETLSAALEKIYASLAEIQFAGAHYRRDIGFRALKPKE